MAVRRTRPPVRPGLRALAAGLVGLAALTLGLAGCGGDAGDRPAAQVSSAASAATSAAASAASSAASAAKSAAGSVTSAAQSALGANAVITVVRGKVSGPDRVEVNQGQRVRLVITSDRADQVHVHGYEIEKPLPAGRPVTIELTATKTGLFEIETHEGGRLLTQLLVR